MFNQIKNEIVQEAKVNPNFIPIGVDLDVYFNKLEKYAMFQTLSNATNHYGFVAFYANDLIDFQGFITMVHVSAKHRGKGVAKTLVNTTCETMKSLGMLSCALEVLCSNSNAINLYKTLGFMLDEEKSNSELLYMVKKLELEA